MNEREQLIADLKDVITRIGEMCANGHPPKMSVPAQHYDDDLVIFSTIKRAIAALSEQGEPVAWLTAFDEARDDILNERGPLAEAGATNDQINSVLSILDDSFMPLLKRNSTPQPLQGWVMVPVEPPRYLVDAMVESDMTAEGPLVSVRQAANLYRAMIAAAQEK